MKIFKTRIFTILMTFTLFFCMTFESFAVSYSRDKYSTSYWHHDYIDTQEAWDLLDQYIPYPEKRIKIATIDTGVMLTNSDLRQNLDLNNCVALSGDGSLAKYTEVKFAHGTSLGSTIAGTSNNGIGVAGVAAGNHNNRVSLMSLNCTTYNTDYFLEGLLRGTTTNNIIKCLNYAANHGARVIQICMGFNEKFKGSNGKRFNNKKIQKAIDKILKKHPEIIIIASAGNRNSNKPWYISSCKGVVSVMALNKYSNVYSSKVKLNISNYGNNRAISAPGKSIPSLNLDGDYYFSKGTSAASAIVAGVAGLILSANPDLSGKEVKNILYKSATDIYLNGFDDLSGYGDVNAYNAVAMALKKAGYSGFPDELEVKRCQQVVDNLKITPKKDGYIKLSWDKCKSDDGKINQYRIYYSKKKDKKFKKISVTNKTSYKFKLEEGVNKCYFIVRPFGTTKDGKRLLPEYSGRTKAVKYEVVNNTSENYDFRNSSADATIIH